MFDDLRELYQELIFDHGMQPRYKGDPSACDLQSEQFNPMCGDRVCIGLSTKENRISCAQFHGEGCAISMASTSLMLESLQNKSVLEAEQLCRAFFDLIYQRDLNRDLLGKIAVLQGVCQYPARVKCATLAWHALDSLIKQQKEAEEKNV